MTEESIKSIFLFLFFLSTSPMKPAKPPKCSERPVYFLKVVGLCKYFLQILTWLKRCKDLIDFL